MAEMKKLPPSPFGKTCETCLFWIASEREKYYPTEQGGVMPVAKVSIAGLPHGARMLNQGQIELAPCAVAPLWGHTRPDHWCWQHPASTAMKTKYGVPRLYSNPDAETQERLASEQDRAPRRTQAPLGHSGDYGDSDEAS